MTLDSALASSGLLSAATRSANDSKRNYLSWLFDAVVCALILAFGVLQFSFYERSADFVGEDVSYYELAHSLLQNHTYAFNGTPETVQPPGLPLILAIVCWSFACAHTVLLRAAGLFFTLGLLVAYWFIRLAHGRVVAAVSCLLVASSPVGFAYITRWIVAAYPYLLTSMVVLVSALKLDAADSRAKRVSWQLVLGLFLVASVLLQMSAFALIASLGVWLTITSLTSREKALKRIYKFLPPIVLALLALSFWVQTGLHTVRQWPLEGYPGSYFSQVILKSGNQPELGRASFPDFVLRFATNLHSYTEQFVLMFTNTWINLSWASLGFAGIVILVALGLADSILRRRSRLDNWYFLFYSGVYFLWPWPIELRFFLPVVPFLCAYLFDGIRALPYWAQERPRPSGIVGLPLFAVLGAGAIFKSLHSPAGAGHQLKLSAVLWVLLALVSLWMLWKNSNPFLRIAGSLRASLKALPSLRVSVGWALKLAGVVLLFVHISAGFSSDLELGQKNLHFALERSDLEADIEAATWLRAHASSDATVMARHVPITYHYSARHVIWFPPISSSKVLMDGVLRLGVRYIVVVSRNTNYYLPPESICFDDLRNAYPGAFQQVMHGRNFEIYQVNLPAIPLHNPLSTNSQAGPR
jgi:hypothetical protein